VSADLAAFAVERKRFHAALLDSILTLSPAGVPSNADVGNRVSVAIASGVMEQLRAETSHAVKGSGQTAGNKFESVCADYIERCFSRLGHLRPGLWEVRQVGGRNRLHIAIYEQYAHLAALDRLSKAEAELAAALGSDYTIAPDIVVARHAETDEAINSRGVLVDGCVSTRASLRGAASPRPILHASISCKWTLRSDRAQNARSEALNLIRNRKGRLPHIAVVSAEPLPSRLASIALGTGDIDCVYHFALPELQAAVAAAGLPDARDLLAVMVDGRRLKDVSDLPLDLAV
jgi:hypothetical protein